MAAPVLSNFVLMPLTVPQRLAETSRWNGTLVTGRLTKILQDVALSQLVVVLSLRSAVLKLHHELRPQWVSIDGAVVNGQLSRSTMLGMQDVASQHA